MISGANHASRKDAGALKPSLVASPIQQKTKLPIPTALVSNKYNKIKKVESRRIALRAE